MIFVTAMFIGHNLPKIYKREVIQKSKHKYNTPLHNEDDPNVKIEAHRVKDFGGGLEEWSKWKAKTQYTLRGS